MAGLTLEKARKKYGDLEVIHGIDLTIEQGEFCVFVGPSGCGKSTLLRMIAGLEETTDGKINIGQRDVTHMAPAERGIAMVFQTYALYPHMSVEENMGFGLRMNGVPKQDIKKKVDDVAKILKLEPYLNRKPKALSGGQRQRVAIGRALVRNPEVFLFDEPLSNLDAELRVDMRVEIARLHAEIGATMIYVTHDQVEAMTLADKIVVLQAGQIEQVGSPIELYENPDNKFVAGFIGSPSMNFIPAQIKSNKIVEAASLSNFELPVPQSNIDGIDLGIRPEHILLSDESCDISGTGKIDIIEHLGGVSYIHVNLENNLKIIIETRQKTDYKRGQELNFGFNKSDAFFFDKNTGKRLR